MFWTYNNTSSPQFEAVLQKEGITLQELMDQEDVIQECKLQNKKLVEFLCRRQVLEELVTLITEEPSCELDERVRFKYANIACELLTCDVPTLNESLSQDPALLDKLYAFIEREPPLNPLLASFLGRTLGVLIVKRIDQHWISYQFTCLQAMGFLKDKENFISLLLKHLGTSAIMDLTLKLVTEVGDVEHRHNLLNWLDGQKLVESLIALLEPQVDPERHYNVSQLLCDILRVSRDALADHRERTDSDPILTRLESPETVELLLGHALRVGPGGERSDTAIVGCVQVLLALLGQRNMFNEGGPGAPASAAAAAAFEDGESERKQRVAESTARVIRGRLGELHGVLLEPPRAAAVRTSVGVLEPPLGNTRLQVVRLIAALIATDIPELLRDLISLGTIELLLDLFFRYVWNNFLHAQVEQCLAAAFRAHCTQEEGNEGNAMYPHLIIECRLLGRILEAWDDNEQKQTKPKGVRQGYMGHLINIANNVVRECEQSGELGALVASAVSADTRLAWDKFAKGPLAEANRQQQVVLGGVHPSALNSEDATNDDYNMQATIFQQQIQYDLQMQQMNAPELIDSYSFRDGDFRDDTDNEQLHSTLDRCANITLNVEGGELRERERQAEIFRKVCSEYISTFDDGDDSCFEETVSGSHTGAPPPPTAGDQDTWDPRGANTSDDDELPDKRDSLDQDADPWFSLEGNKSKMSLSECSANPWSNADASNIDSSEDGGWADFGNLSAETSGTGDAQDKEEAAGGQQQQQPQQQPPPPPPLPPLPALSSPDSKQEETDDEEMFECASDSLGEPAGGEL